MLLHLDKGAGRCTEWKALCTCACARFISAQLKSLFHTHLCPALPVTVALELQPFHAGNVPDTVICAAELGQEWQRGFCISRVSAGTCWAVILPCPSGVQSPRALRGGDVFTAGGFGLLTAGNTATVNPLVSQWFDKLKDAEVVYHLLSD